MFDPIWQQCKKGSTQKRGSRERGLQTKQSNCIEKAFTLPPPVSFSSSSFFLLMCCPVTSKHHPFIPHNVRPNNEERRKGRKEGSKKKKSRATLLFLSLRVPIHHLSFCSRRRQLSSFLRPFRRGGFIVRNSRNDYVLLHIQSSEIAARGMPLTTTKCSLTWHYSTKPR